MSKTLAEIAVQLKNSDKKVQLIYAFNGTGKTRLSRAFKDLVSPKKEESEGDQEETAAIKILYYNALTEDLFYWDNDLEEGIEPKLRIQPNVFTDFVLKDQGQDINVISKFQNYTSDKLTPRFNEERVEVGKDGRERTIKAFSEVTFSFQRGNDIQENNIKISKGEESLFIWSIFHTLLEQVINIRNIPEPTDRETDIFNELGYIFIDDPVSSLDENHLIELAVNLARLLKSSQSDLKFVLTTHNPLFYNVLHNELKLGKRPGYFLKSSTDGSFTLEEKQGDSNRSFSYHLHIKKTLEEAIQEDKIERFHFTLLRNLYEKTASFLGYPEWADLLPDEKLPYLNRIIQFTSHSSLSNEAVAEPSPQEKATVELLLNHLKTNYGYFIS